MRTSAQSFDDFVVAAWANLRMPAAQAMSHVQNLRALYSIAVNYNPDNVSPKTALFGESRYASMEAYVRRTQTREPHLIRMQDGDAWRDVTASVDTFAAYYTARANGQSPPLDPQAEKLALRYLHVYPFSQAVANWQIGLNVTPPDMAVAMSALVPLLNEFPDIDHMKFLGPGADSKADAVIVYLQRTSSYAELRRTIINAAVVLNVQSRVGAMVEAIGPGISEAAEPPAGSFTTYRCLVVYLAYFFYQGAPMYHDFRRYLDRVMALFGLDPAHPHLQGPLRRAHPAFSSWWQAFTRLHAAWLR